MRTILTLLASLICFSVFMPSSAKQTERNILKKDCGCIRFDLSQRNGLPKLNSRDKKKIANIKAELIDFSGDLRSYANENTFDYHEFFIHIDAGEKTLENIFEKSKWFLELEEVSSHFWFAKNIFLAMKDLTEYLRIFNRDMQPINELLYKLFEFEIHVYRIIDSQGNLDLSINNYVEKLLGFYLRLRDLKRNFEQTKSLDHLASWLFTLKVRKLDQNIKKLWLQVPKKKEP